MRRIGLAVAVVLVVVLVAWALWPEGGPSVSPTGGAGAGASEGAVPELHASRWNEPVRARGARSVKGVVLRGGQPVSGATVTATAAHGEEVLSDLPCQCDNHCGQKLLACGCSEASGQLVELVASRTGEGVPLGRATSAADGTFQLEGLDDTKLTLWADAPGAIGWLAEVAPDTSDVKLEVTAGRTLEGKVTRSDGSPAGAVVVTAIFSEQSRFFDVVTDGAGAFRVGPVPPGKYAVVTMQTGFIPDHKQVGKDDVEPLALELSTPRSLSGTVQLDGKPLRGATVKLDGMHRKRTLTTGEAGTFSFERLRPGEYDLEVEAAGGLGEKTLTVGKHEDLTGVVISLGVAEAFAGKVVDERQAALEGVRVSVAVNDDWKTVTTNAQGEFSFKALPPGVRDVHAAKRGYFDFRKKLEGAQQTLTLTEATHITGRVQAADGVIVPSFTISAVRPDAGGDDDFGLDEDLMRSTVDEGDSVTSTDGGFSLDVHPGAWLLTVDSKRHVKLTTTRTAPASDVVLTLTQGAALSGVVLDLDGKPVARARVYAERGRSAVSAIDGRFLIEGLTAGTLSVRAMPDFRAGAGEWSAQATVTLQEGKTTEVTLAPKEGAALAGVVLNAAGEPLAEASVTGWSTSTDGGVQPTGMGSTTTDAEGRFRLRTLPAGEVNLAVEHKTGRASEKVHAPDEHLVIKLKQGTTLSGRVVDESGKPLTVFKVLQRPYDDADGRFTMAARVGKQTVAFDAQGYAQRLMEVAVKEGANELGDIALSKGREVSGLVIDFVTRAPVSGALVDVSLEDDLGTAELSERLGAVKTDAQGRYRLVVDAASKFLVAAHPDYVSRSVPLGPNVNRQDVTLEQGATLTVRVVDGGGAAVSRARVFASKGEQWKLFEPKAGAFVARGLAPGKWVVRAQTADDATYRPVSLELAKDPATLTLSPATDGATVRVETGGERQGALLAAGDVSFTSYREFSRLTDGLEVRAGVARHVPAGRWTLVLTRFDAAGISISTHPVEVPASGEVTVKPTPQWRALGLPTE